VTIFLEENVNGGGWVQIGTADTINVVATAANTFSILPFSRTRLSAAANIPALYRMSLTSASNMTTVNGRITVTPVI
jgi:hypothetical protein